MRVPEELSDLKRKLPRRLEYPDQGAMQQRTVEIGYPVRPHFRLRKCRRIRGSQQVDKGNPYLPVGRIGQGPAPQLSLQHPMVCWRQPVLEENANFRLGVKPVLGLAPRRHDPFSQWLDLRGPGCGEANVQLPRVDVPESTLAALRAQGTHEIPLALSVRPGEPSGQASDFPAARTEGLLLIPPMSRTPGDGRSSLPGRRRAFL